MLLAMGNEIKITVIGPGYVSLYDTNFTIHEPLANPEAVVHEYKLETTQNLPAKRFDALVLDVSHTEFLKINLDDLKKENTVLYDVKGILIEKADSKL